VKTTPDDIRQKKDFIYKKDTTQRKDRTQVTRAQWWEGKA